MDSVDRAKRSPGPEGTRPVLTLAAESIAATSGVAATVVDVVHQRALKHYGEALRQYLAVRLGSLEQAGAALGELRAVVSARGAEVVSGHPGVRANLFREARAIAQRRIRGVPRGSWSSLPWRPPRQVGSEVVQRVRGGLADAEAEALELCYARELPVDELAHVLGLPEDETRALLSDAETKARALAEQAGARAPLDVVLLESFALEPEAQDEAPRAREALGAGVIIGGRYAIERRVGSGSFGDVYRANDVDVPGHVVALKLLHQPSRSEQARTEALRELHLIASVFHPSVVQFKDSGWFEDRLWFVMPWYEGETLQERIARAPLSRAEARRIFEPLARALATMHAAGIRHQDVKPDNIFLARIRGFGREGDEEILPVLIDLGVAAKEAEMVVAGTPNYFAPEVAAQFASVPAKGGIGAAADVFSLALSLRNALEPRTQQDVPAGAVEAFIRQRATEMPGLPEGKDLRYLAPSLRRWLSLDPAERPSADDFADELAMLTFPEEQRRRRAAILRWVVPVFVTVAVVFSGVVYALNQRAEQEKIEADRAKMMASGLREDLALSREQRKALEHDVAAIRTRYEQGQLTRTQMARELGRTEAKMGVLQRGMAQAQEERRKAEERLEDVTASLAEAQKDVDALRNDLNDARSALASTMDELADMRQRLADAERRAARLEGEAAAAVEDLEAANRGAEQARRRAQRADERVAALEAEVARLERQLAQRESRRTRVEVEEEPPDDEE